MFTLKVLCFAVIRTVLFFSSDRSFLLTCLVVLFTYILLAFLAWKMRILPGSFGYMSTLAVLGHKWLWNKRLHILVSSSTISPLNSFITAGWAHQRISFPSPYLSFSFWGFYSLCPEAGFWALLYDLWKQLSIHLFNHSVSTTLPSFSEKCEIVPRVF